MATAPHLEQLQGDGGNQAQSSALQAAVIMVGPMELATGPVADRSRKDPDNSNSNQWLGKTIDEAPDLYQLASPFSHLSKKTPPLLFLTGEFDHPERNLASRQRLRELGGKTDIVVYKFGKHGCWNQHPWFEPMLDDMDAFFASVFNDGPAREKESHPELALMAETDWGEIRRGPSWLELHLNKRPVPETVEIPRLNDPIGDVYFKHDKSKKLLKLTPGTTTWSVNLGNHDDVSPIVVVETKGLPRIPRIPRVVSAGIDLSVTLAAHDATIHGETLRFEPQPHKNTIGYWVNAKDWCEWHFYLDHPGRYDIHVLQGCGKGQGGSKVAVTIGEQSLNFEVEDTGHFQNFKDRIVGAVELTVGGLYTLQIRPLSKAANAIMDVRQVQLVPAN
jgi:hypothetical protein